MSKANTQPPKGTRDFLPDEIRRRSYVIALIRGVFQAYGFEPLETPALERLATLTGKYGEEGDQLLFKILLRGQPLVEGIQAARDHIARPGAVVGGRSGQTAPGAESLLADLGLRYDLTVPLSRVVAAYRGQLPEIFKRYQIQPVWRADTPGRGRFREFFQCDVDVVGTDSRLAEAEVMAAAATSLSRLGFDSFTLRLNHRGLLHALVEIAGVEPAQAGEAITAIDKLDRGGEDGVRDELSQRGIPDGAARRLLEILGDRTTLDRIKVRCAGHGAGEAAIADIEHILDLAAVTSAAPHLRFDATLARGMGYYTGCIFEIAVPDLAGSLGGGGRYDGLVGMFSGRAVPACGFSLGLERILVVMQERGMYPQDLERPDLVLAAVDDGETRVALHTAQQLRDRGLFVDLRPAKVKPGKLKRYASERGIPLVAWFEPGETKTVTVWSQDSERDASVPVEQLADRVPTGGL